MEGFNIFGLAIIFVIMIPNIIYAIKAKNGFENLWHNKAAQIVEQIGRIGCFGFMIVNVPGTWFGWWSDEAFALYFIINAFLVVSYLVIWAICFRENSLWGALSLSIISGGVFLFSGIMSRSVLLLISAILFTPCHILISLKNVKYNSKT